MSGLIVTRGVRALLELLERLESLELLAPFAFSALLVLPDLLELLELLELPELPEPLEPPEPLELSESSELSVVSVFSVDDGVLGGKYPPPELLAGTAFVVRTRLLFSFVTVPLSFAVTPTRTSTFCLMAASVSRLPLSFWMR